jgi:toxin ParE1/3/4
MSNYKLSNTAKEDLLRIYKYGAAKFGMQQADKYFAAFFESFETISDRPYSFEAVDFIRPGYRRCVCGADTIYFRLNDSVVEIMAIVGRQDLNQQLI